VRRTDTNGGGDGRWPTARGDSGSRRRGVTDAGPAWHGAWRPRLRGSLARLSGALRGRPHGSAASRRTALRGTGQDQRVSAIRSPAPPSPTIVAAGLAPGPGSDCRSALLASAREPAAEAALRAVMETITTTGSNHAGRTSVEPS